ncbi:calcium-binding protein [Novosphingobium sp. PASSN1]|uniref:calcium-binding protein n=1 Tax=Novosphingobium sp. PASSN1 TaxID=2015561 RepID=UPI000BCEF3CE|nr:calcium-binding protein [Novosphingobium sp. PASSN1]OYU34569.1 MAG: hypothetical protein CFE35_14385 [Novosphingobium sp. PASSN1]
MADYIGTAGNNRYTGTAEADTISGEAGADILNGGDGNDYIASAGRQRQFDSGPFGYADVNSVDTGAEKDALIGGAGDDHFFAGYGDSVDGGKFDRYERNSLSLNLMGASSGVVADFTAATVTIGGGTIKNITDLTWVSGSAFGDTITAGDLGFGDVYGMGGNDHLIGGYYTVLLDGGDGADLIELGAGSYGPVLRGGAGNDTINAVGSNGATAYGDAGDDHIEATGPTYGGTGNDKIIAHETSGRGVMLGDEGNDTISVADNFPLTAFGGAGADKLIGNGGEDMLSTDILPDPLPGNVFTGFYDDYAAHRDTVDAGAGNDLIAAGIGDTVEGGAGTDRLRLTLAGAGQGITLALANLIAADGNAFGGGKITGIEVIEYVGTTNFADSVRAAGTRLPETLDLLGGNDVIRSNGSAITIDGGDGNDRLLGTKSGGIFNGGAGYDKADFTKAAAKVTVLLYDRPEDFDYPDPYWQEPGIIRGVSQLSKVEEVLGSGFGDKITGNRLANLLKGMAGDDLLDGGGGNDTLDGGAGTDRLDGGAGDDTYVITDALDQIIEAADGGSDTVRTAITWKLAGNVENLELTGSAAADGTGNAGANRLVGNAGANVLMGYDGKDELDGRAGADRLDGGSGDDIYLVTRFADHTTAEITDSGSGGRDELRIATTAAGRFTAYAGEAGLERVVIGTGTDAVSDRSGTAAIDLDLAALRKGAVIIGNAGINGMIGTAGDDLIGGGLGSDTLSGSDGADTLFGEIGRDVLNGGNGADLLYGGEGADRLTGGTGVDTFAIGTDPYEGIDTITDFVSGTDKLLVINPYLSGLLLAGGFRNGTYAQDQDDLAVYDRSSGRLYVDYDGNGPQGQVLLAMFTPGTNLAASDIQLIDTGAFQSQTSAAQAELLL